MTASVLRWAMRFGVAGALLYLLFSFVPFREVAGLMTQAQGTWVAAGFVVLIFERLAAAWRMKLLAGQLDIRLSVLKLAEIGMCASFYSTFLPSDLAGGAVRWHRMAQPQGQRAQAFAAIVFERLVDTIVLVVFGLLFWLWDDPPFATRALNAALVAMLAGLLLGMVVTLSKRISAPLQWIIARIPWERARRALSEKTEKVLTSVQTYRELSPAKASAVIGLTALRHALSILILICFAQALSMTIGFVTIAWIRCVQSIITLLPITFAGLGVREASFVILMQPYGVPAPEALALSLFAFVVRLAVAAVGGVLEIKHAFTPAAKAQGAP